MWCDIISLGNSDPPYADLFKNNCFKWQLGSGNKIKFWTSTWLGTDPLCHVFPRLFNLSVSKDCCIRDLYSVDNGKLYWNFNWKRPLRGRGLSQLLNLLGNVLVLRNKDEICVCGFMTARMDSLLSFAP